MLLHMIEIRPDMAALFQYLHNQGLDFRNEDEDLGYGIHAWLGAAFGDMSPKPWRLLMDRRRPARVLAYSTVSATDLNERSRDFADPSVFAVCPSDSIVSKVMPIWRQGRRLGFEVQVCPIGRKSRSGIEKDLFLIKAENAKAEPISRQAVYGEWARERIERDGAAIVNSIFLDGYRLVKQSRRARGTGSQRKVSRLTRPQALIRGELTIECPNQFTRLLAHGVGRHRAFGYGMLLLRPPS